MRGQDRQSADALAELGELAEARSAGRPPRTALARLASCWTWAGKVDPMSLSPALTGATQAVREGVRLAHLPELPPPRRPTCRPDCWPR